MASTKEVLRCVVSLYAKRRPNGYAPPPTGAVMKRFGKAVEVVLFLALVWFCIYIACIKPWDVLDEEIQRMNQGVR